MERTRSAYISLGYVNISFAEPRVVVKFQFLYVLYPV